MNTQWQGFESFLRGDITAFLRHKRALGCRFDNEERALRLFDRYLFEQGVADLQSVTPSVINDFLVSRKRTLPRSFNHLLSVIRRLFDWLVVQRRVDKSPVTMRPRRQTRHRTPSILKASEIGQLLSIASTLPDNNRAPMRGLSYHTIFTLLAGLGLRVGEVSRLLWRDVLLDDALLLINDTKFGKNRIVPFGPKIAERLSQYRLARTALVGELLADDPVFSFTPGRTVNPSTVSQTFHALLPRLQLTIPPGVRSPTVHCLRHSFAVRTLLHWYESGQDPASRLLDLSTFLGHVSVSSTSVYLTITDELLSEASSRFEQLAMVSIPEVKS